MTVCPAQNELIVKVKIVRYFPIVPGLIKRENRISYKNHNL